MASHLKAGILTFHRCINYGSYWQARCLAEGLRERGIDAVLLDHDTPSINRAEWRCALQPLLPERVTRSDRQLYAAKARKFFCAFEDLPRSERFTLDDATTPDGFDAVLVGSDEVWNFCHPWFGGRPAFFGSGVRSKRLVSYAASFGNHDHSVGIDDHSADRLRRFTSISVRDENSRRLISGALGTEPEVVLDPCLQFPLARRARAGSQADYAVVYGHGFPNWFKHSVRAWADRRDLRLVSIGYRNDWADEQLITASPEEFAELVGGSAAVATNFFHGCVFAILNGKPFACAASPYRSNKIRDLTNGLKAGAHLLDESATASDYDHVLSDPLSPRIDEEVTRMRARSDAYLDHALA
jgi:hypothetical protein